MKPIYERIEDLCRVKEDIKDGEWYEEAFIYNDITERYKFILSLLDEYGLKYDIESYWDKRCSVFFNNIILKGKSKNIIVAHYDVVNPHIDNANDNCASVINLIALKLLNKDANIILLDGEEKPFLNRGAELLCNNINNGKIERPDWILNVELTGFGGKNTIHSNTGSVLSCILQSMGSIEHEIPECDGNFFVSKGFDCVTITCAPIIEGVNDYTHLKHSHTRHDTLDKIKLSDMEEFVNDVLLPLSKI